MIYKVKKKIKVYFVASKPDINRASYRMWVRDLAHNFKEIGIESSINRLPSNLIDNAVIILDKLDVDKCKEYKKNYPNNLIGIINPDGGKIYNSDFIIVGSIEEKDSLQKNKNVLLFPLIENHYQKSNLKIHSNKKKIIVGVHGSYTHLSKFDPHLNEALEEFAKNHNIILKIISNPIPNKNIFGKPKNYKTEFLKFNLKTFSKNILMCDIGLVPNIKDNTPFYKQTNKIKGLYDTDYFFRMKNKSNSGRMFVFIQHGIPVIADLTPSNLHILGNPDNGFAVFSKEGWLNALNELTQANNRKKYSKNALNEFNKLYDPLKWTFKLARKIQKIRITK